MPMERLQRLLAALAGVLASAGCADPEIQSPIVASDPADTVIAEAVAETARSNRIVAEIEKRYAGLKTAPSGLEEANVWADSNARFSEWIDIDWNGPVEPLLQSIASRMERTLRIIGKEPVTPVLVSVSYAGDSHRDALRAIDISLFGLATVVSADDGTAIELHYAN